jgi:hypothetical protein
VNLISEICGNPPPIKVYGGAQNMTLNRKFYIGMILIIANFIVGKLAVLFFTVAAELAIAIYVFSWLMLIAGLLLCGREGLSYARMYYRHFERRLKKNALRKLKPERPSKKQREKMISVHIQ